MTIWFNGRTFPVLEQGNRFVVRYHVQGANISGSVKSNKSGRLLDLLREQKIAAGGRALLPLGV